MSIIYIAIYAKTLSPKPIKLTAAEKLSDFSWYQRSSVREHLVFASRLLTEKAAIDVRQKISIENFPYFAHVHVRPNGISVVVVTDKDYNERVAFCVNNKVYEKFILNQTTEWENLREDVDWKNDFLCEILEKYQNPEEADGLLKLQKELEEIKDIMTKNINEVLTRGEPLEDLMKKSEDLSYMSQSFAEKARKNNQCCKAW